MESRPGEIVRVPPCPILGMSCPHSGGVNCNKDGGPDECISVQKYREDKAKPKLVIYRGRFGGLDIALFVKEGPKTYEVASPRDVLDIAGVGSMDRRVEKDRVVCITDDVALGQRVWLIMRMLCKQLRDVEQAARKAYDENIETMVKALAVSNSPE